MEEDEYELDSRDTSVLQTLSQNPKGLGFNELQRKTEFPRNTLNRHLKTLVEEKVVSRKQIGHLHNSPTIYKATLSESLQSMAQMGLEIAINAEELDFKEMTKVQLVSMIPHLMTDIAIYQTIWMSDYITHQINKTEFQFALKLISNFVDELKEELEELLNKKDYSRLEDEAWTVYVNESFRASHITMTVKDHTEQYRTVNEIVRDLESLFAFTDSNGNHQGGGKKILQYRYFIERDEQKREAIRKQEENYIKVRNRLTKLQSKLKGSMYRPTALASKRQGKFF